ncbi:MAG: peptide deformylase [Patescibacteria group bacterium]
MAIVTIENKKEAKILRKKTADFDFSKYSKSDLRKLVQAMKQTMKDADGIGLSANQVGLDLNFFVAEVNGKFYAIFNPKIEKQSSETEETEEGCLSVPATYGIVRRAEKVTINAFDINGKKIKIKAWGLLARVFQHETDHLNGKLFIDKAKNVQKVI